MNKYRGRARGRVLKLDEVGDLSGGGTVGDGRRHSATQIGGIIKRGAERGGTSATSAAEGGKGAVAADDDERTKESSGGGRGDAECGPISLIDLSSIIGGGRIQQTKGARSLEGPHLCQLYAEFKLEQA